MENENDINIKTSANKAVSIAVLIMISSNILSRLLGFGGLGGAFAFSISSTSTLLGLQDERLQLSGGAVRALLVVHPIGVRGQAT